MRSTAFEDYKNDVGPGWLPLVEQLNKDLVALVQTYEVLQIKEKFGGLRFYVALPANITDDQRRAAYSLISEAEAESYKTCEHCGTRDGVTSAGGWILTLCTDCRTKREALREAFFNGNS